MTSLEQMGMCAKTAAHQLAVATSAQKNQALLSMAQALVNEQASILEANRRDLEAAEAAGMSRALLDRLSLSSARIEGMADGIRQVAALGDPVGEVISGSRRPNGLRIQKTRVPLGVIGIIFEARPNVTSDAAALCLKAGNAVILRGGKEALQSNGAIISALRKGLAGTEICADAVQLVDDTSHETAAKMMRLRKYIDVLIPRGGAGLIHSVTENSTVPVIETGLGNCHIYVDAAADLNTAVAVTVNAKASRPSVCNAAETLLVHEAVAKEMLPILAKALKNAGVELRGCEQTCAMLKDDRVKPATEQDWATEYNDYIMSVRVVPSLEEAIRHITKFGTGHSECIITDSQKAADSFTAAVDAAAVYVNASTRFTDGGEFGMGAEIGISTQKLHARGPMGLTELTTIKYIIHGDGQIR